jgi:gamma-glutamyltranspeptidase/glutathione hydrolase
MRSPHDGENHVSGTFGKKHPSRRPVVYGTAGAVATSHPLATLAGFDALRDGGTAADACVAAAAMLGVVEPMSTGIGGDAFALVWDAKARQLTALNGSGRAPSGATLASYRERGFERVPLNGPWPITVPGAVRAFDDLLAAHGRLGLARCLEPAIERAERGYVVSEYVAANWKALERGLATEPEAARVYLSSGKRPRAGDVMRLPEMASTMRAIAVHGASWFYAGEFAERMVTELRARGASWTIDDLRAHRSTWDEPIGVPYRGHVLYECPPNGQGLAALIALGILEGFPVSESPSVESVHAQIEAMKLGFADAHRYVADPAHAEVPVAALLSSRHLAARRARLDTGRAAAECPPGAVPAGRDTVYLCAVDRDGNAVSFINSLYYGFGSFVVVPGTGVCLQNRGAGFSLDPAHPNALAPGKRPFHTIMPAMLFGPAGAAEPPRFVYGVMGGPMQPQGHVQVACNLLDFGCDVQEALDAPRWRVLVNAEDPRAANGAPAYEVMLEGGLRWAADGLAARGHAVVTESDARLGGFGGGQIIAIDPETGVRRAGSDPRKDGVALAE